MAGSGSDDSIIVRSSRSNNSTCEFIISSLPCLLLCFSASLLLCFSASLLLCFSASLLLCFSASLLLCFYPSTLAASRESRESLEFGVLCMCAMYAIDR